MNLQNRPPPAFQEYASDTLANMNFRLLSLAERGLLSTMRLECWVNRFVPANPQNLAIILNLNAAEVEKAFTKRLLSFFSMKGDTLFCQDLEDYREVLVNRRIAQSEGGRSGGKKTQKIIKESKTQLASTLQAPPQSNLKANVKVLRREEERREESSKNQQVNEEMDEWLKDYSSEDSVIENNYYKQPKGG